MERPDMNSPQDLDALCQAMAAPDFYPHPVHHLNRIDTHISIVFLTGNWVYKLKKPVYLDFLDFRQLAQREACCQQEVHLNQRLSHGVYVDVVTIFKSRDGGFSLNPDGRIVEYAVKMRQLSDSAALKTLLQEGKIEQDQVENLAQTLAAFYRAGLQDSHIDRFGRPDTIAMNMEENFRQLAPFVGDLVSKEPWDFLCQVSRSFLDHHRAVFERRVKDGHIRDGHGDLRTDHIYFHRGIQIIDCIEFNDRFRYGDTALDLAFLYMDMEHLGYPEWGRSFLSAYVRTTGDAQLYTVIEFYAAYRALVRLKVDAFRSRGAPSVERRHLASDARHYFRQAYRYALQFGRPTLWVLCGLPATGKSSLAEALSSHLSIQSFQSDRLRKAAGLAGDGRIVDFGQGPYRPEWRQQVYGDLLGHAHEVLRAGRSVVLDATFSRRKWRNEARRLAQDLDTNFILVETVCEEETIQERLRQREGKSVASDARLKHLPDMVKTFEAIDELPQSIHVRVDTEQSQGAMLIETVSEAFACKCNQANEHLFTG